MSTGGIGGGNCATAGLEAPVSATSKTLERQTARNIPSSPQTRSRKSPTINVPFNPVDSAENVNCRDAGRAGRDCAVFSSTQRPPMLIACPWPLRMPRIRLTKAETWAHARTETPVDSEVLARLVYRPQQEPNKRPAIGGQTRGAKLRKRGVSGHGSRPVFAR
jgi:hypothetical protein